MTAPPAQLILKDDVALHAVLGLEPTFRNQSPRNGAQNLFARRPNSRMGVVFELRRAFQEGCERNEEAPMGKSCFCDADGKLLAQVMKGEIPFAFVAHAEQDILTALNIADEFGAKGFYLEGAVEAYLQRDLLARRGIPVLIGPVYHSSQLPEQGGGGGGGRGPPGRGERSMTDKRRHPRRPEAPQGRRREVRALAGNGRARRDPARLRAGRGARRPQARRRDRRDLGMAGVDRRPRASSVGTIAAGKDADLNIFSGDPLDPTSRLLVVIIDGMVRYRAQGAAPESRRTLIP